MLRGATISHSWRVYSVVLRSQRRQPHKGRLAGISRCSDVLIEMEPSIDDESTRPLAEESPRDHTSYRHTCLT